MVDELRCWNRKNTSKREKGLQLSFQQNSRLCLLVHFPSRRVVAAESFRKEILVERRKFNLHRDHYLVARLAFLTHSRNSATQPSDPDALLKHLCGGERAPLLGGGGKIETHLPHQPPLPVPLRLHLSPKDETFVPTFCYGAKAQNEDRRKIGVVMAGLPPLNTPEGAHKSFDPVGWGGWRIIKNYVESNLVKRLFVRKTNAVCETGVKETVRR